MAIIIGGARHDENGKYVNGQAGDQLQSGSGDDYSGEVSLCEFYVHKYGWYVLHPKTAELANKLAERMLASCNNRHIGYDQNNRNGIIKYGIDTTTDTECDCSSDVRECVIEASGKDPGDFTTANEASALEATGLFDAKYAYTSGTKLYVGDVLVSQQKGHTVIVCYGYARTSDSSGSTGSTGSGTTSSGTTGSTGSTSSSKLSVDGQIGSKTVTKLQQVMGQTGSNVDGFIDGQPSNGKKYWTSILTEACKWTGGTSAVVKKLQQYLINKGYSCGSSGADGLLGVNTAKALQKFLIAKGYSCGSTGADGYFGTNSAKGLQNWLNAQ